MLRGNQEGLSEMVDYQASVTRAGDRAAIDEGLRAYMSKVYGLMSFGVLLTAVVSYIIGQDLSAYKDGLQTTLLSPELISGFYGSKWGLFGFAIGAVVVSIYLQVRVYSLSTMTAQALFWVYAAMIGVLFATFFARYTDASIAQVFLITAISFMALSLYGYTTKKDLSGMGTFLFMAMIGVFVGSILNFLVFQSGMFQFIISMVGLLVFAGLTVYDTQQIKNDYLTFSAMGREGEVYLEKGPILGAVHLYISFIAIFQYLMYFLGSDE